MELRVNQVDPTRIGIEFFSRKNKPGIIVAPTAFGKSVVIAKIVAGIDDQVVILQPTKELLEQNYKKFMAVIEGDELNQDVGIYSASFGIKQIRKVTYATIGSIKEIGHLFKDRGFTKMIIDEAHLYPREMDSMLGKFLESSGIDHVLGLTATPLKLQTNTDLYGNPYSQLKMLTARSKKGNFFKEILYVSQVREMVELGFWAKMVYEQHEIDGSKLVFNSTKADYTEESIKRTYEGNGLGQKVKSAIEANADRKSVLVFVPSVAEAQRLAAENGGSAVYGDMDKKERDFVITGFKSGRIRTIYNVNVLSVGFDHPGLDCIIMARATASLAWFYQALGRGTRILPGIKHNCLVIDFSGNVGRFGKLEHLEFLKEKDVWKLYGEGGKLLTGMPLHELGTRTKDSEKALADAPVTFRFGKYRGQKVEDIWGKDNGYCKWALDGVTWTQYNMDVKKKLQELSKVVTPA